jgi:hypothetical protein
LARGSSFPGEERVTREKSKMTRLVQAVLLLAGVCFAGATFAPGGAAAATKLKTMNQLLVGKQTLTISPVERKAVLSASKGGLSFSCNGIFCACTGDADCNDMFTTNVCGPRAICIDNVCYCSRN